MDFIFQRAKTIAHETAKISQDIAKEAAKFSQELALETAKKSKELAVEATKKADQLKAFASAELSPVATVPTSKPSEEELEVYGVTPELQEFVKGFKIKTFREYPSEELDKESEAGSGRQDLTEWQEKHAVLLLQVIPEISDFRYVLCPRRMKESRFWRIYFKLVENFIAPYQARANISADKGAEETVTSATQDPSGNTTASYEPDLDAYLLALDDDHGDDGSDTELDKLINSVSDEEGGEHEHNEASSDGVLVDIPNEETAKAEYITN